MKIPFLISLRLAGRVQRQRARIEGKIEAIAQERLLPSYLDNPNLYHIDGYGLVGTQLACNVKYTGTDPWLDLGRVVA